MIPILAAARIPVQMEFSVGTTHPANFSDCAMMGKMSDDTMFNVIKNGGAATGRSKDMPAWSSGFEDGEIHDLVAYLMTFCKM